MEESACRYEVIAATRQGQSALRVRHVNHLQAIAAARDLSVEYPKHRIFIECKGCLGRNFLNPDGTHTPKPKAAW